MNKWSGKWKVSVIQENFSEEERLELSLTGRTRVLIRAKEAPEAPAWLHWSPCFVGLAWGDSRPSAQLCP